MSSGPGSMSGDCLFKFCLGPDAGSSLSKLSEKNAVVPGVPNEDKESRCNR